MEAEAEAEAIALRGDAKAFAVEAKAKAEAEQMAKKADAWNEYGKAALMDMMLKVKFFFIRFHLELRDFEIFRIVVLSCGIKRILVRNPKGNLIY